MFGLKKAPAANLKGNKNTKTTMIHIMFTIFGKKKAPAAALRQSKNEVYRTSPDFTGLHWNSPEFIELL